MNIAPTPNNCAVLSTVSPLRRIFAAAVCGLLAITTAYAASTIWNGGAASDIKWSNPNNWTAGVPDSTASVFFLTNAASDYQNTPNNTIDQDTTVLSLSYQSTNTATYHTTLINPGVTLTISNNTANANVLVGGGKVDPTMILSSAIQGPGAKILIVASNGIFNVGQARVANTSGSPKYTLDMSEVDSLTGYLGRVYVAGDTTYRVSGVLYLPRTNLFVLNYNSGPAVLLGQCSTGAEGGVMYLGMTNAFFSDYGIWIGFRRSSGSKMSFNPSTANGGFAYFRNRAGTGRQSVWSIGDGRTQTYSGNASSGEADFSLGTVDALVSDLVVGRTVNTPGAPSLPGGGAVGKLTLSSGTIDANTVTAGYQMVDHAPRVEATINVDGTGKLIVNQSMLLGRFMEKTNSGAGNSFAKLNIGTISGGGTVIVKGPITTIPGTDQQSEINIRGAESSLYAKNSVGPLEYLELTAGSMTVELDGNPTAPVIVTSNLLTSAGFKFQIQAIGLEPGRYTLIDYGTIYSGAGMDDLVFSMPAYLQGFLSNNVANTSIDLWITNNNLITVWNGDKNDNWDLTTANWKNPTTGASKVYAQNDLAKFDDNATGSGNVVLTTDVTPAQWIVNNSAKAYAFSGSGAIKGSTGLVKEGTGTLTIANSGVNDFTGAIDINGGTLKIGSPDRLPSAAAVSLADTAGVKLDLNSQDQTIATLDGGSASAVSLGTGTLTVTGSGSYAGIISGDGQLVKSTSGILTLSGANTYTGGTVVDTNASITVVNTSGSALGAGSIFIKNGGTLRIGNGSSAGGIGSTTVTNDGSLTFNVTNSLTFPNLITGSGSISKEVAGTVLTLATPNDFTGPTYINQGAILVTHPQALGSATSPGSAFSTRIPSTSGAHLELANNVTLDEAILFSMKTGTLLTQPGILSVSGTNTLNGLIILESGGSVHNFSAAAGSKLIVNSEFMAGDFWTAGYPYHGLGGDGEGEIKNGFINGRSFTGMTNNLFKIGNGTWTLWGSNTYTGFTVISNGTLVVNGSILGTNQGPNYTGFFQYFGCAVRPPGTLKGDGLFYCAVTNAGTFSPGSTIGTMTISNALAMLSGSTNIFEIGPGAYDKVEGLTSVVYGGTLKVVLTRSLSGGEVFKLFSAASYSGTFDTVELPALAGGLGWDSTQLAVDGTLRVTGGTPKIDFAQSAILSDGNFKMTGTATASGSYRVLATTNLVDAASWIQVGSGSFDSGAFSYTDLSATNYARRYYRIVAP